MCTLIVTPSTKLKKVIDFCNYIKIKKSDCVGNSMYENIEDYDCLCVIDMDKTLKKFGVTYSKVGAMEYEICL